MALRHLLEHPRWRGAEVIIDSRGGGGQRRRAGRDREETSGERRAFLANCAPRNSGWPTRSVPMQCPKRHVTPEPLRDGCGAQGDVVSFLRSLTRCRQAPALVPLHPVECACRMCRPGLMATSFAIVAWRSTWRESAFLGSSLRVSTARACPACTKISPSNLRRDPHIPTSGPLVLPASAPGHDAFERRDKSSSWCGHPFVPVARPIQRRTGHCRAAAAPRACDGRLPTCPELTAQ